MKASRSVLLFGPPSGVIGVQRGGWKWLVAAALLCVGFAGCMKDDTKLKWTEDVLLPDGRTVTLTRYQEFRGASEIGQPPSESYYWFEFRHPDTGETVRWETKREPGSVALFIHKQVAMLLAAPNFGSGRRDFGCPNPPYLLYQHIGGKWERVDLSSIPIKRLRSNMTYAVGDRIAAIKAGNGHLGVETTANATYQFRPWVMDFTNVKQTFDSFNCVNESDTLLVNETNERGVTK
jgi:hypothetical protein